VATEFAAGIADLAAGRIAGSIAAVADAAGRTADHLVDHLVDRIVDYPAVGRPSSGGSSALCRWIRVTGESVRQYAGLLARRDAAGVPGVPVGAPVWTSVQSAERTVTLG
jgi:hypothetical protein